MLKQHKKIKYLVMSMLTAVMMVTTGCSYQSVKDVTEETANEIEDIKDNKNINDVKEDEEIVATTETEIKDLEQISGEEKKEVKVEEEKKEDSKDEPQKVEPKETPKVEPKRDEPTPTQPTQPVTPTQPTTSSCSHNWVAETQKVWIEETGHYEKVQEPYTDYEITRSEYIVCQACGGRFPDMNAFGNHVYENQKQIEITGEFGPCAGSGCMIYPEVTKTPVTKYMEVEKWVTETQGHYEDKATGKSTCSKCGETK